MGREVTNLSAEEAAARLEEQLQPQTDWPEPTEVNDRLEAAERDAIAEMERLERAGRED
jgi:hypothetical protein